MKLAKFLRSVRGKTLPNNPKGLPSRQSNEDYTADGQYRDDGLSDPGILHGVTGTGNGPIIGIG